MIILVLSSALSSLQIPVLLKNANELFHKLWPLFSNDETGGCLSVFTEEGAKNRYPVMTALIGSIESHESAKLCYDLSIEKGSRLAKNITNGHVLSWQSRNDRKKQYAGAYLHNGLIYSFAGVSELKAEAFVILLTFALRKTTLEEVRLIAEINKNHDTINFLNYYINGN